MSNEVLVNSNSITLDFPDDGGTVWHLQVSKAYLDFRSTLLVNDNTLASSTKAITPTGNAKYFWRYKPKVGGTWQPWSEVSMFIVNTSASGNVASTGWTFVSTSDVTDLYLLENQPITARMAPLHLWEGKKRNRKGVLKSEQYETKYTISLDLTRGFLGDDQKAEIMRFYNAHTSFYLTTKYTNQTEIDFVYRIWDVMFSEPPQLDIQGGNILNLEEV